MSTTSNPMPSLPGRLFATMAGLRLTSAICPAGQRLALARGGLQVFASMLTGTGLAAFVCFLLSGSQGVVWYWEVWGLCVAAMLLLDAWFNVVLNLSGGAWFGVLLTARLALTLMLAQFSGDMLLLQVNQGAVRERAHKLANDEFDASLSTLVGKYKQAQEQVQKQQEALSAFALSLSKAPVAGLPPGCDQIAPVLSDDPATGALQRRAERERLAQCSVAAQTQQSALALQQQANQRAQTQLQNALDGANTELKITQTNMAAAQERRATAVQTMAASLPKQTAALHAFMDESSAVKLLFWVMLGVILLVESLALLTKLVSQNLDQAALTDHAVLLEASVGLQADIAASRLVQRFTVQAARSSGAKEAAAGHSDKDVHDALVTHHAVRTAHRAHQRMRAGHGL